MPNHTRKILLPIDGSNVSRKAATYAAKLAKTLGAEIACIHVVDTPPVIRGMNPALVALYYSQAERRANKWLGEIERFAKKEDILVKSEVVIKALSVPDAIVEYVKKHGVDLVVIGTRGRTPVKKLLLGSVAYSVAAHAQCPVLLVR